MGDEKTVILHTKPFLLNNMEIGTLVKSSDLLISESAGKKIPQGDTQ